MSVIMAPASGLLAIKTSRSFLSSLINSENERIESAISAVLFPKIPSNLIRVNAKLKRALYDIFRFYSGFSAFIRNSPSMNLSFFGKAGPKGSKRGVCVI